MPASSFISPPALVSPSSGESVGGVVRFSWLPTGLLPHGAAYEVVWWNTDELAVAARGFAPPTTGTLMDVNLAPLYAASQFRGSQVNWTVLIVQTNPYLRLTAPGAGEIGAFYYSVNGGGGVPATPPPPPKS